MFWRELCINYQVFVECEAHRVLHRAPWGTRGCIEVPSTKRISMSVGRQVVKHVKNFNDAKTGSVQLHSCARWDGVTHPIRVCSNVLKRKRPLRGGPIGRALGRAGICVGF